MLKYFKAFEKQEKNKYPHFNDNITKYDLYIRKFYIITNADVINLLPKVVLKIYEMVINTQKMCFNKDIRLLRRISKN